MKKKIKKICLILINLILLTGQLTSNINIKVYAAEGDCTIRTFDERDDIGFCASGFKSEADINKHNMVFKCNNCGSNFANKWFNRITSRQTLDLAEAGRLNDGKNTVCYYVAPNSFTQGVHDAFQQCMEPLWAERMLGSPICLGAITIGTLGATTLAVTGGTAGPVVVPFTLKVTAACIAAIGVDQAYDAMSDLETKCTPKFDYIVEKKFLGKNYCKGSFSYQLIMEGHEQYLIKSEPFQICSQINNVDLRGKCLQCAFGNKDYQYTGTSQDKIVGIWTAVGCIPTKKTSIIKTIVTIGISMAGGIALLIILAASFKLSVSQGDPKAVNEAKDMLSAAIIGLIFIILSITILQFIGVQLFQIPGFGE